MNAFNRLELQALYMGRPIDLGGHQAAGEIQEAIMSQRFGVEYQPIVGVQSGEIEGYQATARFWGKDNGALSTQKVFAYLRHNPELFLNTELELKRLQILHSPTLGWLMLDLDIENLIQGGDTPENPFLVLFREHAWTDRELTINLVKHTGTDAERLQHAITLLQQSGTALAFKDTSIHWGLFSLSSFLDASMIKFDGAAVRALTQDAAKVIVEWLVSAARNIGVQTIMSEVNSCEQLEWARKLGVDNVQGRLFKRQITQARAF